MAEEKQDHRRVSAALPDDERPDSNGYVAGKKVNMSELMAKDQDDEALQKYKASLLKNANAAKFPDDPRHIIVESFTLDFGNGHAITIDPSDKSLLEKPFKIKEASTYRIKIKFYAQHEIVSGLKYMNFSYKHGIRVDKVEETIGSFGPNMDAYTHTMEEETAPDGWLARGNYTAKARLIDDDEVIHMEFEYAFELASEF